MRAFADAPEKLDFSIDELCVAACCAGFSVIPCVKPKLTEMKYESVKIRVEEIIFNLASKSAVELSISKRPTVLDDLRKIINIICAPEIIISINRNVLSLKDSLDIFFVSNKAVVVRNKNDPFFFSDMSQLKTELIAVYDLTEMEPGDVSFTVMLSELKHAKRMFDSFQIDSAEEYLAPYVGEGKELIMNTFSTPKGSIIMKRWTKTDGGYENDLADIILVRDRKLYRTCCSPYGIVSVRGISSEHFSDRINEYLRCKG